MPWFMKQGKTGDKPVLKKADKSPGSGWVEIPGATDSMTESQAVSQLEQDILHGDFGESIGNGFNKLTSGLPNPLSGIDEIGAVLDAAFKQVTKVSMWRSVGWIWSGVFLVAAGVGWFGLTEAGVSTGVLQTSGKKAVRGKASFGLNLGGLKSPVIPLALITVGGYLIWFGVRYWENTEVIWPTDPVKSLLQGKGMPSGSKDITATAYLTAAESSASAGIAPTVTASGGSYPNARVITSYLTSQGYSPVAASGIYGNVYQESSGNPEAGGPGNAGLIQWTPGSAASPDQPIMTGNPSKDLGTQLYDILTWAQENNAGPEVMNQAQTPQDAAKLWMDLAERPGIPALPNRQAAAAAVYKDFYGGSSASQVA